MASLEKRGYTYSESAGVKTVNGEFQITGLPTSFPGTIQAALTCEGVPRVGQALEGWPELVCVSVDVGGVLSADDTRTRVVSAVFDNAPVSAVASSVPADGSDLGGWRIDGQVRTVTETRRRDWRGDLMLINYQGYPYLESLNIATGELTIVPVGVNFRAHRFVTAEVDTSLTSYLCKRWQREHPLALSQRFDRVVNADNVLGHGALQVLTEGFAWTDNPQGGYDVQLYLTQKRDGWLHPGVIKINGAEPVDLEVGNGLEYFELYEPKTFAELGLPDGF